MTIRDWDIVTSYVDSVTTTLKTVTFPKVQEQVKVKSQGNANLTYTIGTQTGTLTPGQSVTVNEAISSFTLQAASGVQSFELRAVEQGTEKTEDTSTDVVAQLAEITPRPVIFDTDWAYDVDDAVAARILAWAERCGMIDIVALSISLGVVKAIPSLDAFFTYEGRPNLAIGSEKNWGIGSWDTETWHNNLMLNRHTTTSENVEDSIRLYRRALTSCKKPIDFIVTGTLFNIANLMKSDGDDISPLTGLELIKKNVRKMWVMGGQYPNGSEANFIDNPRGLLNATYVCDNFPKPITFLGWEVGDPVVTGGTLATVSPKEYDVLTQALFDAGYSVGRSSWDPMLTLLACYDDLSQSGYSVVKGFNHVDPVTGANTFEEDTNGNHEYVVKLYPNAWYQRQINTILEKVAWPIRKIGGQQLPRV